MVSSGRLRIAVYAIAKNEESFCVSWAKSCEDADYRIVTDTGSQDRTRERLRECGVEVREARVDPWRFDRAREISLSAVPMDVDVCIALDLDEVLTPGWREKLETAWQPGTTRLRYPEVCKWQSDGTTPAEVVYHAKVHARWGYAWRYPIHEILFPEPDFTEKMAISHEFQILHRQKPMVERRALYREMLRELRDVEPKEPRHRFFYAQEMIFAEAWSEAIQELDRFLRMPESTGKNQERAMAWRLRAWTLKQVGGGHDEIVSNLFHAAVESPMEREHWMNLSTVMVEAQNWANAFSAAVNGLKIQDPMRSFFVDPSAWADNGAKLRALAEFCAQRMGIPVNRLDRWIGEKNHAT